LQVQVNIYIVFKLRVSSLKAAFLGIGISSTCHQEGSSIGHTTAALGFSITSLRVAPEVWGASWGFKLEFEEAGFGGIGSSFWDRLCEDYLRVEPEVWEASWGWTLEFEEAGFGGIGSSFWDGLCEDYLRVAPEVLEASSGWTLVFEQAGFGGFGSLLCDGLSTWVSSLWDTSLRVDWASQSCEVFELEAALRNLGPITPPSKWPSATKRSKSKRL